MSGIRLMRWGAPILLLGLLLVCERRVVAASTVQWMGFDRAECCYLAPSLSTTERDAVRTLWRQARARIAELYGPLRAQPRLVVADAATYPRFATGQTGMTHYLPTGHVITVVGPRGHNADVIAHELAHAELVARVGYRATNFCMPTWFDEGLAVQFDHRPPFTESIYFDRLRSGWRVPSLPGLATKAGFFAGTRDEVRFHYAAARVAVGRWLRAMSVAEARQTLETIDCGEAWEERFRHIASLLYVDEAATPRRSELRSLPWASPRVR